VTASRKIMDRIAASVWTRDGMRGWVTPFLVLLLAVGAAAQEKAAKPKPAAGSIAYLWHDPGAVERVDFAAPAGAPRTRPTPPFRFVSEASGGTSPKVVVRDGNGVEWRVKGGPELKSESFATRLVSAVGYYTDAVTYVKSGKIIGIGTLKRNVGFIRPDGSFSEVSFERRDPLAKHLHDQSWAWNQNPFNGTTQLRGLKVLVMLLSNWDNKDERDRQRLDTNMAIIERRAGHSMQRVYFVGDWGQTLGAWGAKLEAKGWDCPAFSRQTPLFVQGVDGNLVRFGFEGLHMDDFKSDITIGDVRWLLGYLGRVTDTQLRVGLRASGANPAEAECYAKALRQRIDQLRRVANGARP